MSKQKVLYATVLDIANNTAVRTERLQLHCELTGQGEEIAGYVKEIGYGD